jgi:hypothetical protein
MKNVIPSTWPIGCTFIHKKIPPMRFGILVVLLLMAGCAMLQNTPEQEYVYAMGRPCETNGARINYVSPDGKEFRGQWAGGAYTWPEFQQCVQANMKQDPFASWKQRNTTVSARVADPVPVATIGPPTATVEPTRPTVFPMTPTWTSGNEWTYQWSSPRGSGTFVWVVDREEMVDGVRFYVVKSGTEREIYYRKDDRAYFMDKVNGVVETRYTPPAAYFAWPLTPGAKVEARYTRERPIDRQTEAMALTCETGALEPLTVPAGTFDAAKVTCRNTKTNAVNFEMWLSPAVRHMVKERTYFTYGVRERELTSFRVR